ncbi:MULTISPECIES: hypothetical protein [Halobacillus]|uniref:Uncharacterized protein n=1 Tax=Halobacillus faecis TaxID=360184 RepID=A0A511WMF3_9BACI|nr:MULTISPECIES: hypothetical protein [Halobacillus]MBX0356865.1 hypothetical protein [Halobacillus sp. Nhm2S1]GEN52316.1 hypothetical protein HFA01_05780 [Halobacillus faecis]
MSCILIELPASENDVQFNKLKNFCDSNGIHMDVLETPKKIRSVKAYIEGAWCLDKLARGIKGPFSDIDGFRRDIEDYMTLEFKTSPTGCSPYQLNAQIGMVEKTEGSLVSLYGKNCDPKFSFNLTFDDILNRRLPVLKRTNLAEFHSDTYNWEKDNVDRSPDKVRKFFEDLEYSKKVIRSIQEQYSELE